MTLRRGLVVPVVIAGLAAGMTLVAACASSNGSGPVSPEGGGGDASPSDDGGGPGIDAGSDGKTDAPSTTCDGDCKSTSLVADFGGKKRTLVRAQFGTQPGDGGTELHTESHLGGQAACPQMNSPSPDYTLIVTAVPRVASGSKLSDRDGVIGTFLDFKGDLGLPPFTKAVSVNLTVVAQDTAASPAWVALDVSAMFREGEVKGHLYAEYCQSLSE